MPPSAHGLLDCFAEVIAAHGRFRAFDEWIDDLSAPATCFLELAGGRSSLDAGFAANAPP
ncbi:hypothetical protein ACFYVR_16075 [Rhodococcus sp. NPDC003318]|uniref:hypothetical protein n=1 Tax=Rhodococcus sp. NPDC003318 TaxID=3364503 RepID=UPI00367C47CD